LNVNTEVNFLSLNAKIYFIALATLSIVDNTKGSWMVQSFCKQLHLLNADVDVVEFLRRMAQDIVNSKAPGTGQTPQFTVFSHRKTSFCKWFAK